MSEGEREIERESERESESARAREGERESAYLVILPAMLRGRVILRENSVNSSPQQPDCFVPHAVPLPHHSGHDCLIRAMTVLYMP